MLRLEEGPCGLLTAERADTGVPLTGERTDRVLATPFAPVAVGVDERTGVRAAAAPGEEVVLVVESRAGVPGGAGFLAVVDDIAQSASAVACWDGGQVAGAGLEGNVWMAGSGR